MKRRLNPIRAKVVETIQFNTLLVWQFFAVVVFGYAFGAYWVMQDSPGVTVSADLPALVYVSIASAGVLFALIILSIIARGAKWRQVSRAINNIPVRIVVIVATTGILVYLIAWNGGYLADKGLLQYDDSPYKFLIVLSMAATVVAFAVYVLFVLFLRYRNADKRIKDRLFNEISAGAIDIEGAIQNVDAFNWIKKFSPEAERSLLTLLTGISKKMAYRRWYWLLGLINLALFGLTAAMIVLYGTDELTSNIDNARANITSLAVTGCWVVTVCWSYATVEFFSCAWTLNSLTPEEKQDSAYGFLSLIYSRFYAFPEISEVAKGKKVYNIYSNSTVGALLQLRFEQGQAIAVCRSMEDFADGLNRYTDLKAVVSSKKSTQATIEVGNNIHNILTLFIFASFWSVVLFGSEVRR